MAYTFRYTSRETIERRLKGRLILADPFAPGTSPIAGQEVTDEILEECSGEIEDKLDLVLGQIYVIPLANQHPILSHIASDFIAAQIISVHFQGNYNPAEGADGGYGAVLIKRASESLQLLTAGHNIYIPGIMPVQQIPGAITAQPVLLPGETLKTEQPDTITRNYTFIGKKSFNIDSLDIDFGGGTRKRARGSEPLI